MIRRCVALMLLCSPLMAEGPLFKHSDAHVDREFQNAYNDIRHRLKGSVEISTITVSSMTVASASISNAVINSATITNLIGTTSGSDASSGSVGEYVESVVQVAVSSSTGQYGDMTSISLTAGDWDITGIGEVMRNGSTVADSSAYIVGVSTTSGNSSAGLIAGSSRIQITQIEDSPAHDSSVGTIAALRMNLTGTKTVYLKYRAEYSGNVPFWNGRLSARRVR